MEKVYVEPIGTILKFCKLELIHILSNDVELSPKEEHSYSLQVYTGSSSDNKSIHRRSIDKTDCQKG